MSRKLIVALAVLSFALMGTTFAAVENIKVSGDMKAQAIMRNLSMGGHGLGMNISDNDNNFLISQIRLRFDADLTENVSATLRFINENTWGESDGNVQGDQVEIDLACVELKSFLYEPLTLTVGRQNLRYGSALIVGDPFTNQGSNSSAGIPAIARDLSLRKSFDAIKGVLDFAPWTIDMVFAQVDETDANGGVDNRHDDEILAGVNAAYDWSSYNGVSEVYFFAGDRAPRTDIDTTNPALSTDNKDKVYVMGARAQMDPTDKITLGAEYAYQLGNVNITPSTGAAGDNDHISAFAILANAEYRFLNDYNAKLGLSYTYLSGDDDATRETDEGWKTMWEDQTPAELLNILMDNSNAQFVSLCGSMMPREDITLGGSYTNARFNIGDNDTTYTPTNSTTTYTVKQSASDFGHEVDAYAIYDYTEDVQFKVTSAYFIPGNVFESQNENQAYSVKAGMTVGF